METLVDIKNEEKEESIKKFKPFLSKKYIIST